MSKIKLSENFIKDRVKLALTEDLYPYGDITSNLLNDNKIIQGDWNWPYDREDTWHALEGEARHIMLYGDMHVDEFVFPPTKQMLQWIAPPPTAQMQPPDPNYTWW